MTMVYHGGRGWVVGDAFVVREVAGAGLGTCNASEKNSGPANARTRTAVKR
jgi:hypothetical protein